MHGAVTGVVSARDLLMISPWPERVPPVAPAAAPLLVVPPPPDR